ncbi:MAG: hypothetical protein HY519_00745 [Candidatus Aenigmarchaeota archaeon]|nr:hypothetical protein [Candidatus Aenigmarchaeota archaeon]
MSIMPKYHCNSEIVKPVTILVHRPGEETELAFEHPEYWGFDPSLAGEKRAFAEWLEDAGKEHDEMAAVLRQEGIQVLQIRELLRTKGEQIKSYLAREFAQGLKTVERQWPGYSDVFREYFSEMAYNPSHGLVQTLFQGLEASPTFRKLPPQNRSKVYRKLQHLMPQASLYYAQDPAIATPTGLVKSRMAMWQRQQEPDILQMALGEANYIHAMENRAEGGDVTMFHPDLYSLEAALGNDRPKMYFGINGQSGANAIEEAQLLATKSESDLVLFFVPDYFNPGVAYAGGNVMHLDTLLMPIDSDTVLGNRAMLEHTVVQDGSTPLVNAYQWAKQRLGRVLEVPDSEQQGVYGWGANVLPLGDRAVLSSNHLHTTNYRLRRAGFHVYAIDASTLTSGFGSFHCMTLYLRDTVWA